MKLSKHFDSSEFRCKCGCNLFIRNDTLVQQLERLRAVFIGKSIHINSGIRCVEYNKSIGGASRSQHLLGTAADITVKGIPPKEVADMLIVMYPSSHGIGRYRTFTHFDVRESKARW